MLKTITITSKDRVNEFGKDEFQRLTTAKEQRETVVSDFVKMCVKADIPLYQVDQQQPDDED
ncbi:UNVERIFIED_CONTAM: hypothetical protein FKN15_061227 [Acipenser sinensis]